MVVEKNENENVEDTNLEEEVLPEEEIEETEEIEEREEAQEVEEKEEDEEYEKLKDQFVRLQADFANYKRRSQEDRQNALRLGTEKLALAILPVLDNLYRGMEMIGAEDPAYEGLEMIERQFVESLDREDIREIKALGAEFDPNLHHAVLVEESEAYESGTVCEVLQKGYTYEDKVIRPSMVKVAK